MGKLEEILAANGLKVTPQRIAVLDALMKIHKHPSADLIIEFIKKNHPNIAIGTVYKTLETFVEKGMAKKVKTEQDIMRYDTVMEKHHHLYCSESNRIEDYYDEELNQLLETYFKKKQIDNFNIEDIKLQIVGTFINNKT
ncbi:MAG TPA: transcriptional repressor [Bacteroidales bacterium]|nr:transcriptional repressor [Bacteroidales bacterium]